jgi:hypothetical protein
MAIPDLFSARQKKERGETPDVYVYDKLPQPLRVQINYILRDTIGPATESQCGYATAVAKIYESVNDDLLRHLGRLTLVSGGGYADEQLANFLLSEANVEYCLDAIELSCRRIEKLDPQHLYQLSDLKPAQAISDLNHRFLEHGIGYQYVSGKIIRIDSQFLHHQVVKPTLTLLQDKRYKGANDEFLKAHEHYRKREAKDCLVYCLKAMESTLKTICKIRAWAFQPTDTAKTLLDVCFNNGLIPPFLQSHYSALKSTLESGVPTVRNKLGGHGQGTQVVTVPPHYAAYALHMTGSAIQFLIEAENALP